MTDLTLWFALPAWTLASLAAIGAKVLYELPAHELEEYCRRRKRPELFGRILDRQHHDALAAESLQVLAATIAVLAGGWYLLHPEADGGPIPPARWAAAGASLALLLLVGGVWLPWAVARVWAAPFLYHTRLLWLTVGYAMWPFTVGVEVADGLLRRLAGRHEEEEDEEEAFEEEILSMVTAGQQEGYLEQTSRDMIEGIIALDETDASDVMTPRSQVDAVPLDLPLDDVVRYAVDAGHTRLPVYEESLDNIVGILYVKDLLPELARSEGRPPRPLREILREKWSVPGTRPLDDLLQDFLHSRRHLAIVVDEYGATAGIVTIEDVLEEIVGEIIDESDKEELPEFLPRDDGSVEVLGRTHVEDVNEELGLDLPDPVDYDTLGGFVTSRLGRIPVVGDRLEHNGAILTVTGANRRSVHRVLVQFPEDREPPRKENGQGGEAVEGE